MILRTLSKGSSNHTMSATRGRGAKPKTSTTTNAGPLTRSTALATGVGNAFLTPGNFEIDSNKEPDVTNSTLFEKEVDAFITENVNDQVERAQRGIDLINQSPYSSKIQLEVGCISRDEIKKMIGESLKMQADALMVQFSTMMSTGLAELRASTNNRAPPDENPERPQAEARSVNTTQPVDSYQNLFTGPPPGNPNVSHSSSVSNRSNNNFIKKEDLAEIKFDGKSVSVKQFIFKLRTLKEANDVSWDYIVRNFFRCVKGSADTWYWSLVQKIDAAGLKLSWEILQSALENDFGGRQSDADISNMMWSRKQKYNESFEDFFDEILKLNSCLSISKHDLEIINILKSNCTNRIVSGVYNYTTNNAQDFKRQCMKYENEVDRRFKSSNNNSSNFNKNISEIESTLLDLKSKEPPSTESGHDIEALKFNKEKPKVKCGNCQHQVVFCYRCFTPDVTFPNCKNCHDSENLKESGSARPPNSHSA